MVLNYLKDTIYIYTIYKSMNKFKRHLSKIIICNPISIQPLKFSTLNPSYFNLYLKCDMHVAAIGELSEARLHTELVRNIFNARFLTLTPLILPFFIWIQSHIINLHYNFDFTIFSFGSHVTTHNSRRDKTCEHIDYRCY